METALPSPIDAKIPAGDKTDTIHFTTLEQVESWISKERATWEPFQERAQKDTALRSLWNQIASLRSNLDRISSTAAQLRHVIESKDKQQIERYSTQLINDFQNLKSNEYLHSRCPYAKYVLSLRDDKISLMTLWIILKKNFGLDSIIQSNISVFYEAYFQLMAYKKGLSPNLEAERKALEGLYDDFENKIVDAEKVNERQRKALARRARHSRKYLSCFGKAFKSRAEGWQRDMDGLLERYRKELQLKESVKYWSDKATTHRWIAIVFGLLFVAISGFVVYEVLDQDNISKLLDWFASTETGQGGKKNNVPYGPIFIVVSVAFLIIWILRLISRIFLMNIQALADARDRETMAKTFSALLEEHPEDVRPEEKILMLQALFRPSPTSSNIDDGAPPHWIDVVMERLKKG